MPSTSSLLRRRQARRELARKGTQRTLRNLAGAGLTFALPLLLVALAAAGALASAYAYFTRDLPSAEALHGRLVELSQRAHKTAAAIGPGDDLAGVEREIDEAAAELWGITEADMEEIRRSLEELG